MENIVSEAASLAESGVKELILVAQDVTRYGTDLYGRRRLADLLRALAALPGVEWIRLHYLYPDEIDDELIKTIAESEKTLKYLDIPIQHIDDAILKRMRRRCTGAEIRALFSRLRREIGGLVLRTSVITGLPGEGEEEFGELCAFLSEAGIERAGVFPYSPEEGTPAAEMERPDEDTALMRAQRIMEIQQEVMERFCEKRLGKTEKGLCEGYDADAGMFFGRSFAESPDVDGEIFFEGGEDVRIGEFCNVLFTDIDDGEMVGRAV
jgi:ribosomal protein S12 methylthiotransferase